MTSRIGDDSAEFALAEANIQRTDHSTVVVRSENTTPSRRGRGRRSQGLPTLENLTKLARVWLETQYRLWPNLVADGVIPQVTDQFTQSLVESFAEQFEDRAAKPYNHELDEPAWDSLGSS